MYIEIYGVISYIVNRKFAVMNKIIDSRLKLKKNKDHLNAH